MINIEEVNTSELQEEYQQHLKMAALARLYWEEKGHNIRFYVEFDAEMAIFSITSPDLLNGLPKRGTLSLMAKRSLCITVD